MSTIRHLAAAGAAALLLASASLFAQGKVAFVASDAILDKMPEAKTGRSRLSELQQTWLREIEKMENDIDKMQRDIQQNRLLWSPQEKRDAEAKLVDLQSKLATYRTGKFGPQGEYAKEQEKLMGPIIDKVQKAIEEEARAQKYDIVLDKSNRGTPILYANSAVDITVAVLKRLGVDSSILPVSLPVSLPTVPSLDGGSASGTATEDQARQNRSRRTQPPPSATQPVDPNTMLNPSSGTVPADPPKQPEANP